MVKYWLMFNRSVLNAEVVQVVRDLVRLGKFYRQVPRLQCKMLKKLNEKISTLYGISTPKIVIDTSISPCYSLATQTIFLNKHSLVSYLHECGHHLAMVRRTANDEETIRGWSVSMFYNALPKLFLKSAKSGKIWFIDKAELPRKVAGYSV